MFGLFVPDNVGLFLRLVCSCPDLDV